MRSGEVLSINLKYFNRVYIGISSGPYNFVKFKN